MNSKYDHKHITLELIEALYEITEITGIGGAAELAPDSLEMVLEFGKEYLAPERIRVHREAIKLYRETSNILSYDEHIDSLSDEELCDDIYDNFYDRKEGDILVVIQGIKKDVSTCTKCRISYPMILQERYLISHQRFTDNLAESTEPRMIKFFKYALANLSLDDVLGLLEEDDN